MIKINNETNEKKGMKLEKKDIVVNVLLVISATALIGGFLFGFFNKNVEDVESASADVMDYTITNGDVEEVYEQTEVSEEEQEIGEVFVVGEETYGMDVEDYELVDEIPVQQEIVDTKIALSYEDLLGNKTVKETKRLITDFMGVFYNLDGKYPLKFVDKSKEFMTDSLYESLQKDHEIPTYDLFNRKFIDLEIVESKSFTQKDAESIVPYIVYVHGEYVNAEGKEQSETTDVYTIILVKTDDEYKINNVYPNVLFQ